MCLIDPLTLSHTHSHMHTHVQVRDKRARRGSGSALYRCRCGGVGLLHVLQCVAVWCSVLCVLYDKHCFTHTDKSTPCNTLQRILDAVWHKVFPA